MGSIDFLSPQSLQPLGPDDLRVAAEAFEAALNNLNEGFGAIDAYSARQSLARFIMDRTLRGERDRLRLTKAALKDLQTRDSERSARRPSSALRQI
jgi:hypothetical protein